MSEDGLTGSTKRQPTNDSIQDGLQESDASYVGSNASRLEEFTTNTTEQPNSLRLDVVPFTVTPHNVITVFLAVSFPITEALLHLYSSHYSIHLVIAHFVFCYAFAGQYILHLIKPVRPRLLSWYLHEDLYHTRPPTPTYNPSKASIEPPNRTYESADKERTVAPKKGTEKKNMQQVETHLDDKRGVILEHIWPFIQQAGLFLHNVLADLARHAITTFTTLAVQALKGIITEHAKNLVASLISHFIVASLAVFLSNVMTNSRPTGVYVPP